MANPTHNVCDRPVPSVINSESWLIARIFRDRPTFAVVAGAAIWGKATAKPGLRGLSMSDLHRVISGNQFRRDPSTQSRTAERTLNSAIVHSEISRCYEEYLEIFDEFYPDDIDGSSETMKEPLRGKERVRSLLSSFLAPLHAMAEVGGVSISVRETPIPGDAIDETRSAWTLGCPAKSAR
jgi:hypothetical protein